MINKFLLVIILSFTLSSAVYASDGDDRMNIIARELDCFTEHPSRQGVDWNDVCVTSSSRQSVRSDGPSRDEIIAKSMEQMIEEHQQVAEEMLGRSADDNDGSRSPKTVDDVYDQHNTYYGSSRSVDDLVKAQDSDIKEYFSDRPVERTRRESPDQEKFDEYVYRQPPAPSLMGSLERDIDKNQNTSEIGFEFNRYRYEEPVFDLVTQGNLYGMYVNYTARPAKSDALFENMLDVYRAEVRLNYGLVDYKSTPSGTLEDNKDWAFEARLLLGKDLMLSPDARVTPYIGFGYRYLNDDSAGRATSIGHIGYERESRYYYIPFGAELTTKLTDSWVISPNLEYDYLIHGEQLSNLSDVDPIYPDFRNKQRKGFGLRGSLKFIQLRGAVNFVLEPYVRYWHIEDSEERSMSLSGNPGIITGLEPENKTFEYGLRLGAMF